MALDGMRCVSMLSEQVAGGGVKVSLVFAQPDWKQPTQNLLPPSHYHIHPHRHPFTSTMAANDLEYPDDLSGDLSASVRRHHTISAARRPPRAHPRVGQMSETAAENEDEVVGSDWVGGVGAVGEGKGLHRQSSLPSSKSKYTNSRCELRACVSNIPPPPSTKLTPILLPRPQSIRSSAWSFFRNHDTFQSRDEQSFRHNGRARHRWRRAG